MCIHASTSALRTCLIEDDEEDAHKLGRALTTLSKKCLDELERRKPDSREQALRALPKAIRERIPHEQDWQTSHSGSEGLLIALQN